MTQDCTIDRIIHVLSELESQLKNITPSETATVINNEQSSERSIKEKRTSSSWCDRVSERVKKIGKVKNEASNHASDSGGSQGGSRRNIGEDPAVLEIQKLQNDIRQMKAAFENLTRFQTKMSKSLEPYLGSKNLKAILEKTDSIRSRSDDLKEIRKKIFTLKCEIPSLLYKQSSKVLSTTDSQTAEEIGQINEAGRDINLPGLHVPEDFFKSSPAFIEVVEKVEGLDDTQKHCLLSFAVFPENREVKRTMLMYWWIGEGFIDCDDSEKSVRSILDDFSVKGLLEQVQDERKLEQSSYKMEPHVHSAVIFLAKYVNLFELYDEQGKLIMKRSEKEKVCLVRDSSLQSAAKKSEMKPKSLKTVFNSSERYPDFTFKWFPEMDSLRVLYLGRWERTAKRHIEVESTEFLKYMKALKNLRLASFQGISRIEKLENYVCELPKLVILDLRACYNLEVLPDDIGSLKSLIYLDVSECYMLDRMPKGIADLSNLQVLKGFVISQSDEENNCAVKHLFKLKKLSITVNKFDFKVENLMASLKDLKQLESLKIAWGARFEDRKGDKSKTEDKHNVHKKGQTSEEKKGDGEEKVGQQVGPEDGISSQKGDGDKEKVDRVQGKKPDGVKAESLKSDKKESPSRESTETIQKGKSKVGEEGDGDKGKADQEEGKKHDEVKAESLKSDKKESPSRESTETIQNKPDDQRGKSNVEGDGDKGKADLQDEAQAEKSKSDKVVEGEKKASPSRESSDTIQKNQGDKSQVEKEGGGDKGKAGPVEGKKQDEVKAESSKSNNGVEGVKKESPSGESKDAIQKKPDDKSKVENERDGDKGKADQEEAKKRDEVEAEKSKSDNGVEGVKKASPSRESTDTIQKKPDDHQRGDKQEEKGDGEKEKVDLDEGKKKDEVKAESSKPDKVIEENEKTSPPQESKDTIQSKPDDHQENSKVQEKGDGEKNEADLKKLDGGEEKTKKFGKKVSFSEEPKAMIQKKESRLCNRIWSMAKGYETKKRERGHQEITAIDTSKLPSTLKKLELECFPDMDPPSWLHPKNLDKLEKLSIKGGKLSRISDEPPAAENNNCPVQILRLKYLHEFKAEWKDLHALFPQMRLFEKFKCPKVGFCPTDGNGVWRSQPQASPDMPR